MSPAPNKATNTFRVHFTNGRPIDVVAGSPDEARKAAVKRSPGGFVSKIKRLKPHGR